MAIREKLNENRAYAKAAGPASTTTQLLGELGERVIELYRANPMLTRPLFAKLLRLVEEARCGHVLEIGVCTLTDIKPPRPTELGKRYGVTRQAISKDSRDAVKRLQEVDPSLAKALYQYSEGALKDMDDEVPVEQEPDALPPIDTKGISNITEPYLLEDRLEYMGGTIIRAMRAKGEEDTLVMANGLRHALETYTANFMRHYQPPKGKNPFAAWKGDGKGSTRDACISRLVDTLVYDGEDAETRKTKYGHDDGCEPEPCDDTACGDV